MPERKLSIAERILGLSKIWKEANYNFAYFDQVPDLDWEAAYQDFIPKVIEAEDLYEYYRLLQQFTALLEDAHSSVYFPPHIGKSITSLPFHIEAIGGKFHIVNVAKGLADKLPLFAEVKSINGKATLAYLEEEVLPYTAASAPHSRLYWATQDLLKGRIGEKIELAYEHEGMTGKWEGIQEAKESRDWIRSPFKKAQDVSCDFTEEGIAHLQINNFNSEAVLESFRKLLPLLYAANAILLDLRFNLGGNSQIAREILKYFTDAQLIPKVQGSSRKHLPSHKALGSFLAFQPNSDWKPTEADQVLFMKYYQGRVWELEENRPYLNDQEAPKILFPMLVLTSPDTASSSEDFLVSFQGLNRGKLMGSKTCGSTGAAVFLKLPGEGIARICARKCSYPDSREFVGYGIEPDIPVELTLEDWKQGDIVKEKGISFLKDLIL
ncbi:MAG: S41 family peptidase [Bacteroidia bacterium]|nr:S41 family peptidase [Bacteroidia bacterium]